jgi:hypothetical protein
VILPFCAIIIDILPVARVKPNGHHAAIVFVRAIPEFDARIREMSKINGRADDPKCTVDAVHLKCFYEASSVVISFRILVYKFGVKFAVLVGES